MDARGHFLRVALASGLRTISGGGLVSPDVFGAEEEVTANEDLTRKHGVLRRALLVYFLLAKKLLQRRAASRLKKQPALERTRQFCPTPADLKVSK
jgi:hypothetical protein